MSFQARSATKRRFRLLIVLLVVVFCLEPAWASASAPASVSVIVSETADVVQKFAAHDLREYMQQITCDPIALGNTQATHHIYLGDVPTHTPAAEASELRAEVENLAEDGFLIRSLGPDVVILGKGSRGTLYGCYAFLERQGVRWFFPGKQYEVVPHHALNWRLRLKVSESPAFPKRILFYWPNNYSPLEEWIDFSAKVRLNRLMFHYTWPARDWYLLLESRILPELQKRGMEIEVGGHFLSTFLPRTLFAQHPDWFRLNKQGKRASDFNLNPFNQEALDYVASGALEYLLRMPEASLFHLWADDIEGGGWSHEPGREEYTPSDQSLLVSNYLVKRLRDKLPHANLAFLAYHDTVYPPHVVKPARGVIYFYAPRERCYAHALNDPACDLNRKYAQALENGMPAFGPANAEVFEYYADEILFENMTNPPIPDVLSADMRYYHELGIPAVGALMTNTSNFMAPAVNMFLYPQALWNPARDLNQSLQDYATLYFGDRSLQGYFKDLSRGLEEVVRVCQYQSPGDAWDDLRVDRESDAAVKYHVDGIKEALGPLARASATLDEALRRQKSKALIRRLQAEQISLVFTVRQAKLYYHLLKGEHLYRLWKNQHDQQSGLDALTELALARYTTEQQKRFVGNSGIKGSPLIPGTQQLEQRAAELEQANSHDAANFVGVNISGFASDRLEEQLMNGLSGFVLSGPTGSKAVVWSDVEDSRHALRRGPTALVWLDELGQPINSGALDLDRSPVVVEAKGMTANNLFDVLVENQVKR